MRAWRMNDWTLVNTPLALSNIAGALSYENYRKYRVWLEECVGEEYVVWMAYRPHGIIMGIDFKHPHDAVAFKLRYGL